MPFHPDWYVYMAVAITDLLILLALLAIGAWATDRALTRVLRTIDAYWAFIQFLIDREKKRERIK
jgi:hypothetical protein